MNKQISQVLWSNELAWWSDVPDRVLVRKRWGVPRDRENLMQGLFTKGQAVVWDLTEKASCRTQGLAAVGGRDGLTQAGPGDGIACTGESRSMGEGLGGRNQDSSLVGAGRGDRPCLLSPFSSDLLQVPPIC